MTLKNNGRGNRKAQNKRRKARLKNHVPKSKQKVQLIDGNWSFYPAYFCKAHNGYLTQGLVDVHRCLKRKCDACIAYEESRRN